VLPLAWGQVRPVALQRVVLVDNLLHFLRDRDPSTTTPPLTMSAGFRRYSCFPPACCGEAMADHHSQDGYEAESQRPASSLLPSALPPAIVRLWLRHPTSATRAKNSGGQRLRLVPSRPQRHPPDRRVGTVMVGAAHLCNPPLLTAGMVFPAKRSAF
jgi:hypothetical protein